MEERYVKFIERFASNDFMPTYSLVRFFGDAEHENENFEDIISDAPNESVIDEYCKEHNITIDETFNT